MTAPRAAGVLRYYNLLTDRTSFRDDVLHGLALPRKAIPPKYFYDERGSQLFEAICALPEYYLTRAEVVIMQHHLEDLAKLLGPAIQLVEFGSGASVKTRLLIQRLEPSLYVPIDIAEAQLRQASTELAGIFPWLNISGVVADFAGPFRLPEFVGVPIRRKVVYFPGSTIGNFTPEEAIGFLRNVHAVIGSGGILVVGVDLKKDQGTLEAAYDDAQGVTAQFNLNLLARVNRELGGDFQLNRFRHRALYDAAQGRIEMHLESLYQQFAHVAGQRFEFGLGETIHTEISCKYTIAEFQALARRARFHAEAVWADPQSLFAVHAMMAV